MEEEKSHQRATCPYEGCGKTYFNHYNLKRHVDLKHLQLDRFVCLICHKRLSSKQNLGEHMNTHTGRKPYSCPYENCNETFKQASQLSVHKKAHRNMNHRTAPPLPPPSVEPSNLQPPSSFDGDFILLPPITYPQFDVKLKNIFI